ncbi:hypothetical protein Actkin_03165 [Actinokineospora sp. UTMC 2448]|nr:hypothetical protein Actkin_03165 [Actinokineospora sp. UTMC 2448]
MVAPPGAARIEIDGVDHGNTVLVEAWAHHVHRNRPSRPRSLVDALKILHAAILFPTAPRLILVETGESVIAGCPQWARMARKIDHASPGVSERAT